VIRQEGSPARADVCVYRCAPSIVWTRDEEQTLLIDGNKRSWTLQGVEATLWDLLVLAYPYQRIVEFFSLLLRIPVDEARSLVLATLRQWQREGIVAVSTENPE